MITPVPSVLSTRRRWTLCGACAWYLVGNGPAELVLLGGWIFEGLFHPKPSCGSQELTYLPCTARPSKCHRVPWHIQAFYRTVLDASFKSISFINHDLLKLWRVFIYLSKFPSCCLLCRAVTLWKDGWSFHFVDFILFSCLPGESPLSLVLATWFA